MKCKITIDMDNAAFEPDPDQELARILKVLAKRVTETGEVETIMDANRNKVGTIKFTR